MSALTYSCLNLLYDYTVQTTEDPPPHPVIMGQMAKVGLLANGLYTAAFTLPQWDSLVGTHLKGSPNGVWGAAGLLTAFGALYNLHGIVQGRAFRLEGALGIALVNSMKGSSVAVVCSMLYCSATSPGSCLNPGSSLSAVMITLGGILWVVHGASPKGALARELKRLESKSIV
ncbi:hypothetical protein MMC29_000503 [Sticta canariensis]|nr:hypothetical protein [Sticta canariensis]